MKRKILGLAALLAATGAQFASASDGTINFAGQLSTQTCAVIVNGVITPTVATVTLPTVSTSSLAVTGQVAGQTQFTIILKDCDAASGAVAAFFEAGSGVDPLTGNVKNTSGTATNVQLQLLDASNGHAIIAGNSNQRTNTTHIGVTANYEMDPDGGISLSPWGLAILPYAVQYIAQGAATAGSVIGSVTFSMDYQ